MHGVQILPPVVASNRPRARAPVATEQREPPATTAPPARPTRESAAAFGGTSLCSIESTAIFEHDNTRLKAAIPPEPCQHVHRFAVRAPHFASFAL